MLGIGQSIDSNGANAVVAADPWTGTEVKIEPASGQVVDIMDPATGIFWPLKSLVAGNLTTSVMTDFGKLPPDQHGNLSYTALPTFDTSQTSSTFVSVTI